MIRFTLPAAVAATLLAAPVLAGETGASVCVRNASGNAHVFAAEAPGGERKLARLQPGETLCSTGSGSEARGVVSVYEAFDTFEGCSRLVAPGQVEDMIRYSEFDRCAWSSNS